MKKITLLLLVSIFCIKCFSVDEVNDLKIRIANVSDFDYENLKVNTSGTLINFGTIKASSSSEYKIFDSAYRYAFVEFEIDGEIFTLQPIDYVGETLLEDGNYTYEISVDKNSEFQNVILNFKTD